jgi:uncharacterized protein (DUF362 family)
MVKEKIILQRRKYILQRENIINSKYVGEEEDYEKFINFLEFIKLKDEIKTNVVYIKPNFMPYLHKRFLNYTSPFLINSLVGYLEDLNHSVFILESDVLYKEAFKNHSVKPIARRIGIKTKNVINLSQEETKLFLYKNKSLVVPKLLDREENQFYFINFPKMKNVANFGISCAVKNIYGCFPSLDKYIRYHQNWNVIKAIGGINHYLNPDIHIVDGIKAFDYYNEEFTKEYLDYHYPYGYLFSSKNPLAMDLLFCSLINLKIKVVEYLNEVKDIYTQNYRVFGDIPKNIPNFIKPSLATRIKWQRLIDCKLLKKGFIIKMMKKRANSEKYIFDKEIFS